MNIKKEYIIYIAAAIVVVIGVVIYLLFSNPSGCPLCGKPVSSSYLRQLHSIANNYTIADEVGVGVVTVGAYGNLPRVINNATPFSFNGKPEILYVGGEFCPYCAITRWALVIALMRFGNFKNLSYMESSATDVYASTPTFSFLNSSYSSSMLHFDGIEVYDRNEQNITNNNFTQEEQFVYGKYAAGGIPFIDFANSSVQSGATVSPGVLHGSDWNQILSNLTNQNTVMAQSIIGNANIFTAYICKSNQTLNTTAIACKQNFVKAVIG
jgi:hypothetical protein